MNGMKAAMMLGVLLMVLGAERAHAQAPVAIQLSPQSVPEVEEDPGGAVERVRRIIQGFSDATQESRSARCKTALCWGGEKGTRYALEPLAELPLGKSFSFGGRGLDGYVNNHNFSISLAAGARIWVMEDLVSFGVYLSQPVFTGEDRVRVPGVGKEFPASAIRRPYPGVAIGVLNDTFWIGVDVEQLRNGSSTDRDPAFPPNALISQAVTLTFAIAPFTAFRSGLGTINAKNEREAAEKDKDKDK